MTDIDTILSALRQFNQERDWDQFHNGKDLAIGLSIEAAELLECFLWKAPEEASIDKIREELADVLNFAFQIADKWAGHQGNYNGQDPAQCGKVSRREGHRECEEV